MNFYFEALEVIRMGGWITIPLTLSGGLLWFAIIQRYFLLRRNSSLSLRLAVGQASKNPLSFPGILSSSINSAMDHAKRFTGEKLKKTLAEDAKYFEIQTSKFRSLVESLVMIAPLLGLLGTVIGMIETFESLGDLTLFTQSGGIAGGISQALITTQIGLIIAIPGLLCDRFLKDWESKRNDEVQQVHEIICQA